MAKPDSDKQSDYSRTDVYLEDRYENPKHMFVVLGDLIADQRDTSTPHTLLDIGGATGEFAFYIARRFPALQATVLEYDAALVAHGQRKLKDIAFVQGDANQMPQFTDHQFDITTMIGVMSIFNDFRPSLSECIRVTKPGGLVVVVGLFNEYPVDAMLHWRYADAPTDMPYHPGYNLVSKQTINTFLGDHARVQTWGFTDFELPFDLEKRDDPIRTWTETAPDGSRYLRNGLLAHVDLKFLVLQVH